MLPPQDLLPHQPGVELTAYPGGSRGDGRVELGPPASCPSRVSFCAWLLEVVGLGMKGVAQAPWLLLSGAEDREHRGVLLCAPHKAGGRADFDC